MAWIISRKVRNAEVAPAPPEVDFALVLSRMITSVSTDPEHLRTTVYELARHKLDEQIASEDPEEKDRLADALEVAIQGVETHFSRLESRALAGPDGQSSRLSLPGPASGFGARPARPLGQQSDEARSGRPIRPQEMGIYGSVALPGGAQRGRGCRARNSATRQPRGDAAAQCRAGGCRIKNRVKACSGGL